MAISPYKYNNNNSISAWRVHWQANGWSGWGWPMNDGNASLERIPASPRKERYPGIDNSELLFL